MPRSRAALAALLVVVLASWSRVSENAGAGGRHAWTKPDELRVSVQVAPLSLNPILASNTTESMIDRLSSSILVTADERGTLVPDLARDVPTEANGGISADGKTITYHLRPHVTWHDGAPFTSRDVAFTYRAIMNPKNLVISKTGYDRVVALETPDPLTVVFRLGTPYAPFVDTVFGESDTPYGILPAHLLEKYRDLNAIPFDAAPIGTGPFRVVEWARGDHLDLAPYPGYFRGAPKLKRIRITFSSDENTELNQLRTHDVDWQFEASPNLYRDLKSITTVTSVLQSRNQYERLQMNNAHPPLDDVRVRRAIAAAIDTHRLTDALTFDSATAADQDHPPFMWAHANDVARHPFDLAASKSLFASAGWHPGPGGILEKGGKRLSLTLVTNNTNATRRAGIIQVQEMLRHAGVDVQTKLYLGSQLFAPKGEGGILLSGTYDLAWDGWVAGIDPDDASLFTCAAFPPAGNDSDFFCDENVDAAEHAALGHPAQDLRAAAYHRVATLLAEREPEIPIWWPRQVQPINPDFKHFTPNPVTASWNAYEWEI